MRCRSGFGLVLWRELRRIRRRRFYLLLLVILPFAGWAALASAFARGVPTELPIAIADADHSQLSRLVTRSLEASPSLHVVLRTDDVASAAAAVRRGDVYAVVSLPAGLERSVARTEGLPVSLLYNGQWLLPGNIVMRDVRSTVTALSVQLDASRHGANGVPVSVAAVRAQPIRTEVHALFNATLDYSEFLFLALVPALFHMFVLLVAVDATGRELKHGTLQSWARSAGGSAARALAGKLLPYAAWYSLAGSALLELSLRHAGVDIVGSRVLLHAALALLVLAYLSVGAGIVAITADLRTGMTAAGLIAAPSFAVAGVSFPLAAMPLAARAWAAALPVTHYQALQAQLVAVNAPAAAMAVPLVALSLFSAAGAGIALWRFPALLQRSRAVTG